MRWLASFGLHQHAGAGAVGQLRGVAGGDERARLLHPPPVGEHRLQGGEAREIGVGANAFVVLEGHRLVGDGAGRLVDDLHHARQRRDLGVEPAGGLPGGGARLRLQREFVLALARDLVARRHDFGGLEHRHIDVVTMLDEPWVQSAEAVHLVVLHQRNGFEPAANGDAHAILDDLLGGDGDRHQAGGALAVDRHAGDAGRQAGAQRRLARDVAAGRALLKRRAHDDIVDFRAFDAGARKRVGDGMAAERLGLGVIEGAAIGLADRRSGGGDDDGFTHNGPPDALRFPSPSPCPLRERKRGRIPCPA